MIKLKKTLSTALLLLVLLLGLSGCSKKVTPAPHMQVDSKTAADGTTIWTYDGDEQRFFDVPEGCTGTVNVTVNQERGTLRILICREDDPTSIHYDGHDFPAEPFTVNISKAGRYCIRIHAERFVGTYRFSCSTAPRTMP